MMTKRTYIAVARILRDQKAIDVDANTSATYNVHLKTFFQLATAFAVMFAADNPNFDKQRFYTACGL